MDFAAYQELFQTILTASAPEPPYDKPAYLDYVKLNWSRQQRWLKSGVLDPALVMAIGKISKPQSWIIITEPWCGDAAHIIPFLHRLSLLNPLIAVEYRLRDSPPPLIHDYLTRGARSIPKVIVRDADNRDLVTWGPRPAGCQAIYDRLLAEQADADQKKIALQQWYNADRGVSLQREWLELVPGF